MPSRPAIPVRSGAHIGHQARCARTRSDAPMPDATVATKHQRLAAMLSQATQLRLWMTWSRLMLTVCRLGPRFRLPCPSAVLSPVHAQQHKSQHDRGNEAQVATQSCITSATSRRLWQHMPQGRTCTQHRMTFNASLFMLQLNRAFTRIIIRPHFQLRED